MKNNMINKANVQNFFADNYLKNMDEKINMQISLVNKKHNNN